MRRNRRGTWDVLADRHPAVTSCETLDEARRVAYLTIAHAHPCEVIVQDAYHRVLAREVVAAPERPPQATTSAR